MMHFLWTIILINYSMKSLLHKNAVLLYRWIINYGIPRYYSINVKRNENCIPKWSKDQRRTWHQSKIHEIKIRMNTWQFSQNIWSCFWHSQIIVFINRSFQHQCRLKSKRNRSIAWRKPIANWNFFYDRWRSHRILRFLPHSPHW